MKKLFYFLVLASISWASVSCNKDDDTVDPANLAGVWKTTQVECNNGVSSFEVLGVPFTSNYTFYGKDFDFETTFTENPNEFSTVGSYTVVTTTEILGVPETTESTTEAFPGVGSWEINGNTMIQVFAGDTTELEILELSSSKFRLKGDFDITIEDSGAIIRNTFTVFTTMEKI